MQDGARIVTGPEDNRAILPASVDDFAAALLEYPQATIVAGATDVGLWVTKFLKPIGPAIFIGHLDGLKEIEEGSDALTIGAGASYTDCEAAIGRHFPHLGPYWDRIAGWQGGNIANGSPIGDTPPVLISLGAEVVLRKGDARRTLPLEAFFIDYGKQDRAAGEFVESIRVPMPAQGQRDAAYKISKRRDEDISSVAVGISVTLTGETITAARIAFGGMAATPKRAGEAEAALLGKTWGEAAFDAAAEALPRDFKPLSDWRASSDYRMLSAQNLLRRFYLEQGGAASPVQLTA